jgi:hypothetical protein
MKKSWLLAIVPGGLLLAAGVLVLVLLLLKALWAWTVPDLFPGAVEQGLIAAKISWLAALKVAIFVAILAGVAGHRRQ